MPCSILDPLAIQYDDYPISLDSLLSSGVESEEYSSNDVDFPDETDGILTHEAEVQTSDRVPEESFQDRVSSEPGPGSVDSEEDAESLIGNFHTTAITVEEATTQPDEEETTTVSSSGDSETSTSLDVAAPISRTILKPPSIIVSFYRFGPKCSREATAYSRGVITLFERVRRSAMAQVDPHLCSPAFDDLRLNLTRRLRGCDVVDRLEKLWDTEFNSFFGFLGLENYHTPYYDDSAFHMMHPCAPCETLLLQLFEMHEATTYCDFARINCSNLVNKSCRKIIGI